MTLLIKDGGMTSSALLTQDIGGEHRPFQNVLGSVGITNNPAVSLIGPVSTMIAGGTVALSAGTAILGSVNVAGAVNVLSLPAGQGGQGSVNVLGGTISLIGPALVSPVQFGLSSVVTGQKTMSLSVSVTLASDQPAIAVSGAAGAGSVNVLGGTIQLIGPALVTPAQFGLSSVTPGQKTRSISIPVTLASDQPAISVSGTFQAADVQKVQFGLSSVVVGSQITALSVPVTLSSDQPPIAIAAGAAETVKGGVDVVNVALIGFGLSSATLGQYTRSLSIPVTLASDQPAISVSGTFQAADVQRVQFGLSSTVVGQRTMSMSVPVTLASDQPAIPVSGTFQSNEVQKVQFGFSSATLGQKTMSLALTVTLASDQPAIAVSGAAGAGSVNVLGGTIQLIGPALVTPAQFGLSSVTQGQKTMSISVPVTLASDQPAIPVSGTFQSNEVQKVQFGFSSATLGQKTMSLALTVTMASDQPAIAVSGAAGAGSVNVLGGTIQLIGPALVTPAQFGLSSVTQGQKTMSISVPVTLASDQPAIAVSGTFQAADVQKVQFGLSSVVTGQRTMAASLPMVLASDQIPVVDVRSTGLSSVTISAGTAILGSVNVGGSIAVLSMPQPGVTAVQFGTSSATLGQKTMSISVPVVLASDQPAFTGSLGQKTMSLSVPMTLASDQPPVRVGGLVHTTNPPALSDLAQTDINLDYLGKQITWPFSARTLYAMGTCALQGTTETTLVAAGGSTVYHDLAMVMIAGASSTFSGVAQIRGATASAVMLSLKYGPADDCKLVLARPIEAPGKNMNWTVQLTAAPPNSVYVTAQVVKLI